MAIRHQVLGRPGWDNALFVTVDTGQSLHRLLFDCGEGVLAGVPVSDVQQVEGLFFSHFHFDHVAGFDSFLRLNWCRPESEGPVRVFGPAGACSVIHHRLQGVTWNLVAGSPGEVQVTELDGDRLKTTGYLTREGFAVEHDRGGWAFGGVIYRGDGFDVSACPLNHGTLSLGYLVREHDRRNVDLPALSRLGLKPGPWLRAVKDPSVPDDQAVETDTGTHRVGELREQVLVTQPGESVAYLTDFLLEDGAAEDRLAEMLRGCGTIVCENNYATADAELARKNFHMTSSDVARLAARAQPERLVLFHLSDRYTADDWREQLWEVREQFPRAAFPDAWEIGE
jgi:ribonuclease Z